MSVRRSRSVIAALFTLLALTQTLSAALWLPHSLSDHVLFQQREPIVLWGKAAPRAEISVELTIENTGDVVSQSSAKAAENGKWEVRLKSLGASFQRYMIRIQSNGETRTIRDVLVGELWLTGGQSNMELPLREILGGQEMMQSASCNAIRIFYQKRLEEAWKTQGVPEQPQEDILDGRWLPADTGTNVDGCSGVAYAFALALYKALNQQGAEIPVGVMNTAVGGTKIACWISRKAAESVPEIRAELPKVWNGGPWHDDVQPFRQATALFNLKVAPLAPHAVRGFLWYQGESDASRGVAGAAYYRKALSTLIADWREHWGGQQRPLILTQLAPTPPVMSTGEHLSWAYLREAQFETAQTAPQTAVVAIYDLDPTWNRLGIREGTVPGFHPVHPLDKKPVGQRMALAALAIAYDKAVEQQGPVFERMEVRWDKAVLYFRHAQGLKAKGERLLGFGICGPDRHFLEGVATVVGETVEVSHPDVKRPVAITYAFTDMNHCANLFNGADLPAFPFRTDQVKSIYLGSCASEVTESKTNKVTTLQH